MILGKFTKKQQPSLEHGLGAAEYEPEVVCKHWSWQASGNGAKLDSMQNIIKQ